MSMQSRGDKPFILILNADLELRQSLLRSLEERGYHTASAASFAEMREQVAADPPDLILLDIDLPGEDGLQCLRSLTDEGQVAVVVLMARDNEADRIIALELGADECIVMPVSHREILARLKSVLRRYRQDRDFADENSDESLFFDGWTFNLLRRQLISPDGEEISLTTGEFKLLLQFTRRPGHVLTRDSLMEMMHGPGWVSYERTVDAQIARLRKKLEVDSKRPAILKSVRGAGYVFAARLNRQGMPTRNDAW